MAVFRFSSRATDEGLDVLRTTPPLLADVRYADIQKIGFSSRGESAWILAGYQIDINGKLFASNDSLELSVLEEQEEKAAELATLLSDAEPLALQIIEGEAFERASLADAADKVALAEVKQKFAELEPAILRLRGMTEGFYPWFEEADELFTPAAVAGEKISSVRIQLLTGTESSAGSGNSIYLKAGGHKYLLSSATDPLDSVNKLQEFTIPSDVFDFDPLRTADLLPEKIGIGMLGSDQAFDRIPDRANIQRVILEADDAVVYDSEKNGADRATLAAISLIPPVHRDNVGFPVENRTTPYEVYLWKPGMPLPDAERKPQLAEMDKPAPKENLDTPENQNLPKAPLLGINPQPRPPVRPLFGPLNSRRRPPTPIIVINFPIVFGGVPPNTPGPTRPVISDVKIVPGNNPVQFGQSSRVSWTVKGNRSQVSRFRVRLYPVLPHRTGTIIRPVADTTSTNSGSRQVTLTPTQTLLSATGISARESQVMFVRPEVTALNSLGQVINGTAATGPILPIFPAGGTPVRLHHASPPPATPPWPVNGTTVFAPAFPSNGPGTRFAIFNGTSFPFSGTITPSDPGSGSAVWRLGGSQFSQGSVFDSYPFSGLGQWAHNTAIRPGAAPLTTLATQYVVFGVPVPQRLVAHVGFIGDRPSWTNRAHVDVDIRVIDFLTPALSRWVRTTTPVVCSKTNNRLTLIDIPIAPGPAQVGQLVPGNAAAPPAGLTGGVPMDFAYLVPAQPDYPAITVGSGVNAIAITISSRQDRVLFNTVTGERQSVGVFGLRLIP